MAADNWEEQLDLLLDNFNHNSTIGHDIYDELVDILNKIGPILYLKDKNLNDIAINYIINALRLNSTIKTVIFSGNVIIERDAEILAVLLTQNKNIVKLDLSNTNLNGGLNIIAEGLKSNSSITHLNLAHNNLRSHFAHFGSILPLNDTLLDINLEFTNLSVQDAIELYNGLYHNFSIGNFQLCTTEGEEIDIESFQLICDRNNHNNLINCTTLVDILSSHTKIASKSRTAITPPERKRLNKKMIYVRYLRLRNTATCQNKIPPLQPLSEPINFINLNFQPPPQHNHIPVWCSTTLSRKIFNLRAELEHTHQDRITALRNLMVFKNNYPQLEFISNYPDYFNINQECICTDFLQGREDYIFKIKGSAGAGAVGVVNFLEYNDTTLILKNIPGSTPPAYLQLRVRDYNHELARISPSLKFNMFKAINNPPLNISAGSTDFSNQTIQHLILNEILGNEPNYIYQYDAFYCPSGGYNIMEVANAGTLSNFISSVNLTETILFDMFEQILRPLSILKQPRYGFVHADLKPLNIFTHIDEQNNAIFKIADYDKSSITWNGIRFYNNKGDYRFSDIPFPIEYDNQGQEYYRLKLTFLGLNIQKAINLFIMHSPNGFYINHDIYTMFFLLMIEPAIWNYLQQKTDSFMWLLWKNIWYADDYVIINNYIESQHKILNSLNEDVQIRAHLKEMRSISKTNTIFGELNLKFKVNLSIYEDLRIPNPHVLLGSVTAEEKQPLIITNSGRICTGPGKDDKSCRTNKYTSYFQIYEDDAIKQSK